MKIFIGILVGVLGTLFLATILVSHFGKSHIDDLAKQRAASTLIELKSAQDRLGVLCVDADKVILNYIDSIALIVGELKAGKRSISNEKIFELGEHVSEVINTCELFGSMLEESNNHMLSNLALREEIVRQEVVVVRLAMARTQASWCKDDCIRDAAGLIENTARSLQNRLMDKSDKPQSKGAASN